MTSRTKQRRAARDSRTRTRLARAVERARKDCERVFAKRAQSEALQWIVPATRTGEEGLRYIVSAKIDPKVWAAAHAQELLDAGYVRVVAEPYINSSIVGDRRNGQRYTREELAALREKVSH